MKQVGKQVALAVENALNFQNAQSYQKQLTHERDRQHLFLEINNAVVSHLNLRDLLKAISACLRQVIPHDLAGISLYDSESRQLLSHALDFPKAMTATRRLHLVSIVQLYKALGGGWAPAMETAAIDPVPS